MRIGIWIMLGSVLAFAAAEAIVGIAESPWMFALQGGLAVIFAGLLVALRAPRAVGYARWIALVAVVAACGIGAQMGVLIADATAVVALQIALVMGAASVVPWGIWPQAATVTIAGVVMWWEFATVAGGTPLAPSSTLAVGVVFGASVFIAHVLVTTQETAIRRDLELEKSQEMLRALSARLVFLQEEERRHIARELHDELGQLLVALRLELNRVSAGEAPEQRELRGRLERAMMVLDETVKAVRNLSRELRPTVLDDMGLTAALDSQMREFRERTGIQCELDLGDDDGEVDVDRDGATALFRIIQEAMTNVAQHADATQVSIRIGHVDGRVALTVEDNGRGITDEQRTHPSSLGLIGMQERARNCGGSVEITGAPGKGTRIRVLIPETA